MKRNFKKFSNFIHERARFDQKLLFQLFQKFIRDLKQVAKQRLWKR